MGGDKGRLYRRPTPEELQPQLLQVPLSFKLGPRGALSPQPCLGRPHTVHSNRWV